MVRKKKKLRGEGDQISPLQWVVHDERRKKSLLVAGRDQMSENQIWDIEFREEGSVVTGETADPAMETQTSRR